LNLHELDTGAKLQEGEYRPDFELLSAYQGFSAELLRLSLIGLGAIGVLMGLFGDKISSATGQKIVTCANRYIFLAAIGAFVASAACALWHRYDSTDSMSSYVLTLRARKRGPSAKAEMEKSQKEQHKKFKSSGYAIGASACLLVLATLLLGIGFWDAVTKTEKCGEAADHGSSAGETG
jgi:hypothetical protein